MEKKSAEKCNDFENNEISSLCQLRHLEMLLQTGSCETAYVDLLPAIFVQQQQRPHEAPEGILLLHQAQQGV
jgi:hypothetical protein